MTKSGKWMQSQIGGSVARIDDGLSDEQAWACLAAQSQARQQLASGVHTLMSAKHLDPVKDAVLSNWALGVESLLKVSLGLASVSRGEGWISQNRARKYGHDIETMNVDLAAHIRYWVAQRGRSEYVHELIDRVASDAVWPILRNALHVYAKEGRFYDLDLTTGRRQDGDPPAQTLEQALEMARQCSPRTARWRERDIVGLTNAEMDEYSRAMHAALADSLINWWFMITRLARYGCLGVRGVGFGADTEPSNALPRVAVYAEERARSRGH